MTKFSDQLSGIKNFLIFFTKKLRLSSPWNYKVPFLITVPYFLFFLSGYNSNNVLYALFASLFIIIGIAGIGYLTNDLGDKEKDRLIDKMNVTAQLSLVTIAILFLLFFSFAILPWFFLPANKWSYVLLVFQFVLFYVYAFPPFRFKERGFLGVLIDAMYAHFVPSILAAYTFFLFTGRVFDDFFVFLILLGSWQFVLGVRNILLHQLRDYESDLQSDTKTFVIYYGKTETINMIKKFVMPAEIFLFLSFSGYTTVYLPFFLPAVILYWLFKGVNQRKFIKETDYRQFAYNYLDDLYINWIPLIVLTGLVIHSFVFIPVLTLHFFLFKNGIKTFLLRS